MQQGVGVAGHLRSCPPLQQPEIFGVQIQPVQKVVQQAGFTHPGISRKQENAGGSAANDTFPGGLKLAQFRGAANGVDFDPFNAAPWQPEGALAGRQHAVTGRGRSLSFNRLDIIQTAHMQIGITRDDDLIAGCPVDELIGIVQRLAGDAALAGRAQGADERQPGANAGVQAQRQFRAGARREAADFCANVEG